MLTNGRMLYQGGFSLAIPGGSVVTALSKLEASDMDFSKMHIFFCNERIGIYTYLNLHHSSTCLDLFFDCFP
jgi:6-phosphogluconolactonase/glucosamine-6-phosphate isomerase/deaminase